MSLRCFFGHSYKNILNYPGKCTIHETVDGIRTGKSYDSNFVFSFFVCTKCGKEYVEAMSSTYSQQYDNPSAFATLVSPMCKAAYEQAKNNMKQAV